MWTRSRGKYSTNKKNSGGKEKITSSHKKSSGEKKTPEHDIKN
jgi:hypothetical protein